MEALMGPFYGLLCVTDPHMELCPHWVFDLLHRIPKVPKWTDTPGFSHVVSFYWPSFGLFAPPLTVTQTMPKVLIWTSTPKLFSLIQILATFWQFSSDQREKMLFCNQCSIFGLLCLE